ncbi:MAG: thioredoxin family protein [Phycisphaerales bacterium JB052]
MLMIERIPVATRSMRAKPKPRLGGYTLRFYRPLDPILFTITALLAITYPIVGTFIARTRFNQHDRPTRKSIQETRMKLNHHLNRAILLLMTCLCIAEPAIAQPSFDDAFGNQPATAQAPAGDDAEQPPVQFSIKASTDQLAPGSEAVLAIILDHQEHWHTNLNQPIVPEEMGDFYPFATKVELPEIDGLTFGPIQWPEPISVPVDFSFTGNPIQYLVYGDQAVIYIPVSVAPNTPEGDLALDFTIRYQACDDKICLMPDQADLSTTLTIAAGAQDNTGPDPIFAAYDPAKATTNDAESETTATGDTAAVASSGTFFGITLPGGGFGGLIVLAILGAVGGLVLNLTPCVLPVIPIKVMTLSQHAGENRAKTILLGFWMALGVIAFWAALAIPVLTLQNFTDPSRIFGIWWLTTAIGLLIAIMSLGLMGMFQINLPQKVYMVNPKADTAWGSFVFGIMTAILGLPCFGFVAGALVPAAINLGTAFVIVLFTSMGVGMALPYLVLSIFPGLLKKLPKTGPASELVKQIMGLLLLAAAAYFIGSGLIALVASKPYLAKLLHIWIAAFFGIGAGGWLIIKTFEISKKPINRGVFSVIALLIAAIGLLVANRFTSDAKEEYEIRQAALAEAAYSGGLLKTTWNDYRPQLMQQAIDEGKIVIQDFTAEWCINCKVLEKTVLGSAAVKAEFAKDDTIMFKVDLTGSNPDGDQALKDLGRTGIPTLAIYGPGLETPWVANAYTIDQVVEAIRQARGEGLAIGLSTTP